MLYVSGLGDECWMKHACVSLSVCVCPHLAAVCGGNAVTASNDNTSEWQELAAAQQPQVDAIFTGDKAANPKSIAVT